MKTPQFRYHQPQGPSHLCNVDAVDDVWTFWAWTITSEATGFDMSVSHMEATGSKAIHIGDRKRTDLSGYCHWSSLVTHYNVQVMTLL